MGFPPSIPQVAHGLKHRWISTSTYTAVNRSYIMVFHFVFPACQQILGHVSGRERENLSPAIIATKFSFVYGCGRRAPKQDQGPVVAEWNDSCKVVNKQMSIWAEPEPTSPREGKLPTAHTHSCCSETLPLLQLFPMIGKLTSPFDCHLNFCYDRVYI